MKMAGKTRRQEFDEMRRLEEQTSIIVERRIRVWTGQPGKLLSGVASLVDSGTATTGYWDLGSHYWVVRVGIEFDKVPGKYVLEYCADPEGLFSSVMEVPESEWIRLAAGESNGVTGLTGKWSSLTAESAQPRYHDQPALFLRFLRVRIEANANYPVGVVSWTVYEDTAIDLSGRLRDGVTVTRKTEGKYKISRFVRPELSFTLANYDGALRLRDDAAHGESARLRDSSGLSYLRSYSRWTFDIRYRGERGLMPSGFEGTNWWPQFCGYLIRRKRGSGAGGSTVTIDCRSGVRAMDSMATWPVLEQMAPDVLLRDWVTTGKDGRVRLCGVKGLGPIGMGTAYDEQVGRTRIFGDHWWGGIVQVDANKEKVHSFVVTDVDVIALVAEGALIVGGGKNEAAYWWLVRYDFGGREIERKALDNGEGSPFPVRYSDLCVVGEVLFVTVGRMKLTGQTIVPDGQLLMISTRNWVEEGITITPFQSKDPFPGAIVPITSGLLAGGIAVAVQSVDWVNGDADVWRWEFFDSHLAYVGAGPTQGAISLPHTAMAWPDGSEVMQVFTIGSTRFQDWRDADNVASDVAAVRGIEIVSLSPFEVRIRYQSGVSFGGNRVVALADQGDFILAAGFGPGVVQEVARVARVGYLLENTQLRSLQQGDVPVLNFAEPIVRIGGELNSPITDYVLDYRRGHLRFRKFPANNLEVRCSYDYRPVIPFVQVRERNRWELAGELAGVFGLTLRLDAFDRLVYGARRVEEYFVFSDVSADERWVLGATMDPDGLPGVIVETIEVEDMTRGFTFGAPTFTVTTEDYVDRQGRAQKRTILTEQMPAALLGEKYAWRVRFQVQDVVVDLGRAFISEEERVEAERVLTRFTMVGMRTLPADFAERIEQVFKVGPSGGEYETVFDRVKPLEASSGGTWQPGERIYERSQADERPQFLLTFNEPLLLGSSRWFVRSMKLPCIHYDQLTLVDFSGKHFVKVTNFLRPSARDRYQVWVSKPASFRVATEEDRADMIGNTNGGDPAAGLPIFGDDYFYVKRMNVTAATSTIVIAGEPGLRQFRKDGEGRVFECSGEEDEERYSTRHEGKELRITLTPTDVNGVPLWLSNPTEHEAQNDVGFGVDAQMSFDDVQVTSQGLRLEIVSSSLKENELRVEVVGYPLNVVEKFTGVATNSAGLSLYGERKERQESALIPNGDYALRAARDIVERRGVEPQQLTLERPLLQMIQEDDWVWVTDDAGVRGLARVRELRDEHSSSGSRTTIEADANG